MKPVDSASVKETFKETTKFAVLELFTSEGCSSCPPAEELMEKLQQEYKDQPVYLLEYHVDYWDRQGWKDVFSNHDYTIRQSAYADLFHLNSIYTPQLVINGSSEMVGSDALKIRKAIGKSLAAENNSSLILSSKQVGNLIELDYHGIDISQNSQVVIAVIRKSATVSVRRGENEGRVLSHVQIVHSLQYGPVKDGIGSASIQLPNGYNKTEWELIAFVQNADNGKISAVAPII